MDDPLLIVEEDEEFSAIARLIELGRQKSNVTIDDIKHIVTGKRGLDMLQHGDVEHGILSIGQIIGLVHDVPTVAELIERIMTEAEGILHRRFPAMTKETALAK